MKLLHVHNYLGDKVKYSFNHAQHLGFSFSDGQAGPCGEDEDSHFKKQGSFVLKPNVQT